MWRAQVRKLGEQPAMGTRWRLIVAALAALVAALDPSYRSGDRGDSRPFAGLVPAGEPLLGYPNSVQLCWRRDWVRCQPKSACGLERLDAEP